MMSFWGCRQCFPFPSPHHLAVLIPPSLSHSFLSLLLACLLCPRFSSSSETCNVQEMSSDGHQHPLHWDLTSNRVGLVCRKSFHGKRVLSPLLISLPVLQHYSIVGICPPSFPSFLWRGRLLAKASNISKTRLLCFIPTQTILETIYSVVLCSAWVWRMFVCKKGSFHKWPEASALRKLPLPSR